MYNIICGYIFFNNGHGYGVLKHLISCLGAYALWYYCNLEVVYNKYYLKHTITISHKSTFVMARRDLIMNTIEKKVKEDSMEAQMWAQRLEDLLENCLVKDVVKEAMTSISWRCTTKKPNLHVAKAHLGRTPIALRVVIFKANHLVKQLYRNSKSLTSFKF